MKSGEDAVAARLDWSSIEEWCGQHETLDLLAEAKAGAAYAWEDE